MSARTIDGETAAGGAGVTPISKAYPRAVAAPRLPFADNIGWAMVLLVLSMHSADTSSSFGNWYYAEHPAAGLPRSRSVLACFGLAAPLARWTPLVGRILQ